MNSEIGIRNTTSCENINKCQNYLSLRTQIERIDLFEVSQSKHVIMYAFARRRYLMGEVPSSGSKGQYFPL